MFIQGAGLMEAIMAVMICYAFNLLFLLWTSGVVETVARSCFLQRSETQELLTKPQV